jgi:hypothetical protein
MSNKKYGDFPFIYSVPPVAAAGHSIIEELGGGDIL